MSFLIEYFEDLHVDLFDSLKLFRETFGSSIKGHICCFHMVHSKLMKSVALFDLIVVARHQYVNIEKWLSLIVTL